MSEFISRDFASRNVMVVQKVSAKKRTMRLIILLTGAVMFSIGIIVRLAHLQLLNSDQWIDRGSRQHKGEMRIASERGPIFDRNGKLLATSVPTGSVYVRPGQVIDKEKTASDVSKLLSLPKKTVQEKLSQKAPFVWVKRQIPRELAKKMEDLKTRGVGFLLESRRYYPYNSVGASLIGKAGVDGIGLSGLERAYESRLNHPTKTSQISRDALGNSIHVVTEESSEFKLPKGNALRLTLDAEIQMIVDEELEKGRDKASAQNALAVMVDADSGEILAMGQSPEINLNSEELKGKDILKNKIVETVFEPGSIMKPFVAASAFELGVVKTSDVFDCENGRFSYAGHLIKDVHPYGLLSFRDVVVRSSNIGMAKIGDRIGKANLHKVLTKFGFGESVRLGLPGESRGILRDASKWAKIDVATHSFGQGVAVTPLQVVRAVSAIANGGFLPELYVVNSGKQRDSKRILSSKAAMLAQDLMYGVVEDKHGTGRKASINGIRVGGKTGTAQKAFPNGGGYMPGSYVASFVGFVDARSIGITQSLALIVSVDEPRGGVIYGGSLAAPIFHDIMVRTLQLIDTREELRYRFNKSPKSTAEMHTISYQPL